MSKLLITDLSKDHINIVEEGYNFINLNLGRVKTLNGNKILLSKFKGNSSNFKSDLVKSFEKKLIELNDPFFEELETFNLRNDKIISISKIINLLKINDFISKNKFKDIKFISDDEASIKSIKSISKKIKVISVTKKSPKIKLFFIKLLKFYLKTFFIISFIKMFSKKNLGKRRKEIGLTIFPNFFLKNKENFYNNKKITPLNFFFTDETHLGLSTFQIIKYFLKIRRLEIICSENFINYSDLAKGLFLSVKKFLKSQKKQNFFINNINFTDYYKNDFFISLLNRSKLEIYKYAIPRVVKKYECTKFHLYLFEYNFGFFIINLLKKCKLNVKGYQHGIFSSNLFWLDIISKRNLKNYLPNTVIANNSFSFNAYKAVLKNRTKIILKSKKNSIFFKHLNFKDKKSKIKNILVLPGTHDVKDFYFYVLDETKKEKDNIYFFKLHPKNKFYINNSHRLRVIDNFKGRIFNKILVSSTSTLIYDLKKLKIPYQIFNPDYKVILH